MPTKPTGRPRGRPKGAKNVPSVEQFVASSLSQAPRPPAPSKKPRTRRAHPWDGMTPEERSDAARSLRAKRLANPGGKPAGCPRNLTVAQHLAHREAQKPIIARIMKKMSDNAQLPDDPMAVEALQEALTVLRSQITPKDKIAAARLVLDFTKAKPTAKIEHTVRTAEDYLDEIAAEPE